VVAPSKWLAIQAGQSMMRRFPIHRIPHGIDVEVYQPQDSQLCRSLLGIPAEKRVLLIVVDDLRRYLKGGDLLISALQQLPASLRSRTMLLTIGVGGEALSKAANIPTLNLGYFDNDRLKTICYSAADVFVLPTRAENFALVLLESIACGTPMVSFDVGGVSDLVRPGITGYLAQLENAGDLCAGIVQLLEDDALRNAMSKNCRTIATKEYSLELQVERYAELYRQTLQGRSRRGNEELLHEPVKTGGAFSSAQKAS
jgi:glycosyltransferase involved in cell wall biosynthesis